MDRRALLLDALALAFLQACGRAPEEAPPPAGLVPDPASNFHRVYDDPAQRDRFLAFLANVFHLYPEEAFHALITATTARHAGDREIYGDLLRDLPGISPVAAALRYALPALRKQKQVMAAQAAALLGPGRAVDGYLEVGTTGRYVKAFGEQLALSGPTFLLHDEAPSKDPVDLVERGQLRPVGTWVDLAGYAPVGPEVADASLDLVSNLIGFHHCPEDRLDGFVAGLHRVLRPGGTLLLREHDARDERTAVFVALAHDVFNAGIALPWEANAAEIRRFRSVAGWTEALAARGFERLDGLQLQEGDPTDNALLAFRRV